MCGDRKLFARAGLSLLAAFGVTLLMAARPPARQTVRLICLPGVPLAVEIGKAHGIFDRYGIEVVTQKAKDAEDLREVLGSQKAEIAHSSVENAIVAAQASHIDNIIVMGGEGPTSELIVQPDIHSVEDLRGRTVILDGADTAYALSLKKILLLHGIKPGVDCTVEVIGLAPQRLAAMSENKAYAATIQKPPTSVLSERAGLKSLGSTEKLLGMGRFQGIGAFVLRSWASANAELLERYIAAFIESQRWLMNPANKEEVLQLMISGSHLPPEIADQTYGVDMKEGWTPDAQFDANGFKNVLVLKEEFEPSTTQAAPERFYDLSYYQNALRLLQTVQ